MPANHAHPDPAIRPGGPQPSRRPWDAICPLTVTRDEPVSSQSVTERGCLIQGSRFDGRRIRRYLQPGFGRLRRAVLYVRQSSLKQNIHNTESAIRQYDLRA